MSDTYSKYNVSIHCLVGKSWELETEEGYIFLYDRSYGPEIIISSSEELEHHNTIIYYKKVITSDFKIEFKNNENSIGYTARFIVDGVKFGVKFDENSNASFENFQEQIQNKMSMEYGTEYYNSGNLYLSGIYIDDELNGDGTEFYDTNNSIVKYEGEFDGGCYDGKGKFFSKDGAISIECNNISRGVPTGYCTLTIYRNLQLPIIRKFRYDKEMGFNPENKNFCYNWAKYFYSNINNLIFKNLSVDDKLAEINKKLEQMLQNQKEQTKREYSYYEYFLSYFI